MIRESGGPPDDQTQYDSRKRRRRPEPEQTVAQVYGVIGTMYENDMLWPLLARHYRTYREMRWDSTISFARMLCVAPLVSAGWTYEEEKGAPSGARDFIERMMEPLRVQYVKSALEGHIDYGWAGYEVVRKLDHDGRLTVKKLKPLLQDRTQILVDPKTGAFWGLRQWSVYLYKRRRECLCVTLDLEGTNFYGSPLMENIRQVYSNWLHIEAAAQRYDKKIAGTYIVIHYPIGTSDIDGVKTNNFLVAKRIADSLQSSGIVTVPSKLTPYEDDTAKGKDTAWKIEMLSDSSRGRASFTERQKYLDSLKVRGLGLPERSVLEGQFGTKAEAGEHADFAIMNLQLRHDQVTDHVQRHVVDATLEDNWGPEARGTVRVRTTPLADDKVEILKDVYSNMLKDPQAGVVEYDQIDTDALRDKLGIPTKDMTPEDEEQMHKDVERRNQEPAPPGDGPGGQQRVPFKKVEASFRRELRRALRV